MLFSLKEQPCLFPSRWTAGEKGSLGKSIRSFRSGFWKIRMMSAKASSAREAGAAFIMPSIYIVSRKNRKITIFAIFFAQNWKKHSQHLLGRVRKRYQVSRYHGKKVIPPFSRRHFLCVCYYIFISNLIHGTWHLCQIWYNVDNLRGWYDYETKIYSRTSNDRYWKKGSSICCNIFRKSNGNIIIKKVVKY